MAESKIKYPNPPIQEAVCEVHFDTPQPFIKERLEQLKPVWAADYPDQKVVEEKNVELKVTPEGIKHKVQPLGHRLICRATDGKRLVQLTRNMLVVNQLKPYPGWHEAFRDLILQQVNVFVKNVGAHKVRRIGLRYIDKIDVPEHPVTWENWFKLNLPTPAVTGCKTEGFQIQLRNRLCDDCHLTMNFVTMPVKGTPPVSPVIFDFDVVWQGQPVEVAALAEILEKLHDPLGLAFEGYLTDKARGLFY